MSRILIPPRTGEGAGFYDDNEDNDRLAAQAIGRVLGNSAMAGETIPLLYGEGAVATPLQIPDLDILGPVVAAQLAARNIQPNNDTTS